MSHYWSVVLALCLTLSQTAYGSLTLRGLFRVDNHTLFAICDEKGDSAQWVKVGDSTKEGVVTAYDEQRGVLSIQSPQGQIIELSLVVATIKDVQVQPTVIGNGSMYLAPELRAKYQARGISDAAVMQAAISDIENAAKNSTNESDRQFLLEIAEGAKAGDMKLIETQGKPLQYEDAPNLSKGAVDRINVLMKMTPEQVQAVIDGKAKMPAPSETTTK